jgi:DNA-binding beta-propeller fold protein YncE
VALAFDGANIWVTNRGSNSVTKLRASDGAPQGTFGTGQVPEGIAFDGTNMWVTNEASDNVTVLRASDGHNVMEIEGVSGDSPLSIAFDGANMWVCHVGKNKLVKM